MKKTDQMTMRQTISLHLRAAKDVNRVAPGFLASTILYSAVSALSPYAAIWLSAQLINELASARRVEVLGRWVVLIVSVTAGVSLVKFLLERWKSVKEDLFYRQYNLLYADKFLSMDFSDSDSQETRDLYTQIQQSENWGGFGFPYISIYLNKIVESIVGILSAAALTVSLFTLKVPQSAGALTVLNNPLFLLVLLAVLAAVTFLGPVFANKVNTQWSDLAEESRFGNRLFQHFSCSITENVENAADMRMYGQAAMADRYSRQNTFGVGSHFDKLLHTSMGLCAGVSEAMPAVLSGVVYGFVCLKALGGAFGIGSVTQYVSAVTKLAVNVSGLLEIGGHMRTNGGFMKTIYEFLDIPNAMYQGSLTTEKRTDGHYEVEFRDVSFRYPGSDLWALRHVNMKFQIGKRLAIVGENGSGKTTFIKLLCRLYDPQEGQILLNGIDIRKYRYDDYMHIFSVVFQDFQLICQPLGANVAGSLDYDRQRVQQALVDAGFGDRLATMEKGLDTMLYKDLTQDGVEVSGGEAQKIAIARALYKNAPFIILDEPTAALDPIAEAEIYAKFDDIAKGKTVLYISHRLSSCKFCDEIAVFANGSVIQQGTHQDLLADETGKYFQLWNAQAQYYVQAPSA